MVVRWVLVGGLLCSNLLFAGPGVIDGQALADQIKRSVAASLRAQGIHWDPNCGRVAVQHAPVPQVPVARIIQPVVQRLVQQVAPPLPAGPLALPQGHRPLHQIVTFQQFTDLLKHCVGKIPELQTIWRWRQETGHSVYFGGGGLRGLLHWLYVQLQFHTVNEIWHLPVPPLSSLMLQKGSDIDLYAPSHLIAWLKQQFPEYQSWDILNIGVSRENVKLGGAGLEKVKVNPSYFDDPLDGLKDYYQGILRFHWPDGPEFEGAYWVRTMQNSRLSEALRYIRFLYNLPEVSADAESQALIRQIPAVEGHIPRGENADYWINKGLAKLYLATGNNLVETLTVLQRYHLHYILGGKRYAVPTEAPFWQYVEALHHRELSVGDLKYCEKMQVSTVEGALAFMNLAVKYVTRPLEFEILIQPHVGNPNWAYTQMLVDWTIRNIGWFTYTNPGLPERQSLDRQFLLLNPTLEQLNQFRGLIFN